MRMESICVSPRCGLVLLDKHCARACVCVCVCCPKAQHKELWRHPSNLPCSLRERPRKSRSKQTRPCSSQGGTPHGPARKSP